jgi:hypothetical protein
MRFIDDLLFPANEDIIWKRVYSLCLKAEGIEVDKQLLSSLREIRNILTGDTLDAACIHVKFMLNALLSQTPQFPPQPGFNSGKAATLRHSSGGNANEVEGADVSTNAASVNAVGTVSPNFTIFNKSAVRRLLDGNR